MKVHELTKDPALALVDTSKTCQEDKIKVRLSEEMNVNVCKSETEIGLFVTSGEPRRQIFTAPGACISQSQ